jgi:hypothetical protein
MSRDSKKIYDLLLCADGTLRGVEVINGFKIDPSLKGLKQAERETKEKDKKEVEEKKKPKRVVSIQDRIREQVETIIGQISGKSDDFINSDFTMKYDCYAHLQDMGCKAVHAKKMREMYLNLYNESVDVFNGEDEYLTEAFGHLKPKYHKKMLDFYGIILDDIDRLIKNATAQRKPRKKKTLSATRLVSKLKYQTEYPDLKLVSINPEKIIGANELWVYNTKYNRLGVYYAQNTIRGFSVKGCTIQQYDEQTSIQKTTRKPKDVLSKLTKQSLRKKMKDMKTKDQTVTGRINSQTILLGAF